MRTCVWGRGQAPVINQVVLHIGITRLNLNFQLKKRKTNHSPTATTRRRSYNEAFNFDIGLDPVSSNQFVSFNLAPIFPFMLNVWVRAPGGNTFMKEVIS